MDPQLKKGVLKLCVLQAISGEARYGYDILQGLHALFPEVDESTIYAILRRLYAEGDATQEVSADSKGPARKYYRLTDQGRVTLSTLRAEWRDLLGRVATLGL